MRRIVVIVYICSFCLTGLAQHPQDSLRIDFSRYFIERPLKNDRAYHLDKGTPYDFRLAEIIHSGKVIDNGFMVDLADSLLKRLEAPEFTPFVVESNHVGAFSTPDGRIFLTSGTFAQAANDDQIAFFLAREVQRLAREWYPRMRSETFKGLLSYNEKIASVFKDSLIVATALDRTAIELLRVTGFNESVATSCIDMIRIAHLPYAETAVPSDYLNSKLLYVPKSFFQLPYGYQPTNVPSILRLDDSYLNTRIQNFRDLIDTEIALKASSYPAFLQAQKESRETYTQQAIFNADFDLAIYSAYLLERVYGSSERNQMYKSYAWMGYALTKMGLLLKPSTVYHKNNSKSTAFFFFLRQLEAEAALAISLRILTDISKKYPRATTYRNYLLKMIKQQGRWNLKAFSTSSYYDILNEADQRFNGNNKYATLDSLRARGKTPLFEDSLSFHRYALSDLVQSTSFWDIYNAIGNETPTRFKGKNIRVFPSVSIYRGFELRETKSSEKQRVLIEMLEQSGEFQQVAPLDNLDYKSQKAIKNICSQLFHLRKYEKVLPTLPSMDLLTLASDDTDYLLIPMFQGAFRPELRGYYFFGLFIAPLPFILPEVLLRSHQSMSCVLVINAKTGSVEKIDFEQFNTVLSPELMLNYIQLAKN